MMSMQVMVFLVTMVTMVSTAPGYQVGGSCEQRCGGGHHALCRYFCAPAVYQHRTADQSDKKNEKVGGGGKCAHTQYLLTRVEYSRLDQTRLD